MSSYSEANYHRSIIFRKIKLKYCEKKSFAFILENQIRMSYSQTLVCSIL